MLGGNITGGIGGSFSGSVHAAIIQEIAMIMNNLK